MIESHRACIASLDAACAAIEAELDSRLQAEAGRLEAHRLLVSIPGIGARVASVLIWTCRNSASVTARASLAWLDWPRMSASPATRRAP